MGRKEMMASVLDIWSVEKQQDIYVEVTSGQKEYSNLGGCILGGWSWEEWDDNNKIYGSRWVH